MLTSGWKAVSMVDVHGKVTFTLWLCGCNLKCPFCHNWRIAERRECFELPRDAMLEELSSNSFLIDYFHVTGGEPLMQWRELKNLLEDVKPLADVSLNTNLTIVRPLEELLRFELVDHIATDIKAPPQELYGLPKNASEKLWTLFLRGLEVISEYDLSLELRIPVPKKFDVLPWIEEALRHVNTNFYVVLNPLVGKPLTNPRDDHWCSQHCWPDEEEVSKIENRLKSLGIKVFINRWVTE